MKRKLVILTEIIAPYRIPVFNALARKKEIDLHVIFLAETDPTQRGWLVYKGEIEFSYEVLRGWRKRVRGHHVLLNWGLEGALRNCAPEVVLCGGYNYVASWSALRWARKNGVEFLLWVESTRRDSRSGSRWVESLKTKFLRQCDRFVVPGAASREYLKRYGLREDTILTAPNAVDNHLFARAAGAARNDEEACRSLLLLPPRYFLFCGRLIKEKGVFDLMKAYGLLDAEIRRQSGLVFVGEGRERKELEQRARAIAPGKVLFSGFAQRDQLAAYYALADALVFPTHSDPWGLVVNEAMACGLPVICSDAAGCASDLIEDHGNGIKVESANVEQLVAAMDELARDPIGRTHMGQRSWERVAHYSPEAWAEGIVNALGAREECAA